jgi:thymidylate synthase ThyX
MKIINPEVTLLTETSPLKRVEIVGRVCTNSYDKMTDHSALPFCRMLHKRNHGTPFEHVRVVVPDSLFDHIYYERNGRRIECIYGYKNRTGREYGEHYMNGRDFLAIGGMIEELVGLPESDDYATLHFVIDIGISRELCRHRQMSFMERSTRYVNLKDGIEFIRPLPFEWAKDESSVLFNIWQGACFSAEVNYKAMAKHNIYAQESRSVLPLSTRTDLFVTGTYKQWNDVFALRLDKSAHPSMRYIMEQAKDLIKDKM